MSAFRTTTALKQVAAIHFRDASNTLVDAEVGRVRNPANALKTFFDAFSAAISPDSVTGYANSAGSPDIGTPLAFCTVSGGVAPFTHLWTRSDGGGGSWTIDNPTAATTNFTALSVATDATAEFIDTVTDNIGAVAVAGPIGAFAINLGGSA